MKEDVGFEDLDDRKREINKREFIIQVNLPEDLFIQYVETQEEDENIDDKNKKNQYELSVV